METPCSLAEQQRVESALVKHYLRSDGPFGAGVLRSIDASPPQLAAALEVDEERDPVRVLARACGGALAMQRVLASGMPRRIASDDTPGFFRYLVMTCAIVAIADRNEVTQDFGVNLALAFDSPNIFSKREALPRLWASLQRWCNSRRDAGEPIRSVVLPPPGAWKHIGITHAITFPGWRDAVRLKALVERHRRDVVIDGPAAAAKVLCPQVRYSPRFTPAMHDACEEYEKLYFAKATLLALHRFWLAVRHALEVERDTAKVPVFSTQFRLWFGSDIEDVELQADVIDANGMLVESKKLDDCVDNVLRDFPEWLVEHGLSDAGAPLRTASRAGFVPFTEEGFGLWTSALSLPDFPSRCVVLIAKDKGHLAQRWGTNAVSIGENWLLMGPLPGRHTASIYQYLGANVGISHELPSPQLRVRGGVRTGGGYLGRPSFLPTIVAPGPGELSLRGGPSACPLPQLVPQDAVSWRFESSRALDGRYTVVLEENVLQDAEPLAVEKTILFVPDALEHDRLPDIDDTRWRVIPEECFEGGGAVVPAAVLSTRDAEQAVQDEIAGQFNDFLEALYAGGRSGWTTQDLLCLMRDVLGSSAPSPWDILRGLVEAEWLIETSNVSWRARRWWLREPTVAKLALTDGTFALLLRGSTPTAVRRRFTDTVTASGCTLHVRHGVGSYSPLSMLATGGQLDSVEKELNWPVATAGSVSVAVAPLCWPSESVDESRHRLAGKWRWERGAFEQSVLPANDDVVLERYTRERGDREDLFVVSERVNATRYVTPSRVAAITEAYRRMKAPFFRYKEGLMLRVPRDGYLVRGMASEAIRRAARNSGPAFIDGQWVYAYPADSYVVQKVKKVFGAPFITSGLADTDENKLETSPGSLGMLRHRNIFRADTRGTVLKRAAGR